MKITLTRFAKKDGYTVGRLAIDGQYFCDTLEPQWRNLAAGVQKVKGCTAIGEGTYPVVITKSPRFRRWCRCWWACRSSAAYAYTRATRPMTPRAASLWDGTA